MVLVAELIGLALLVAGVMMLNVPAGLIVLGVSIIALALAYERALWAAEESGS